MRQPNSAYTNTLMQRMLDTPVEACLSAVIQELVGARIEPDACLMDFCCRSGNMLHYLAETIPHRTVIGVDKNRSALESSPYNIENNPYIIVMDSACSDEHVIRTYEGQLIQANLFTSTDLYRTVDKTAQGHQRIIFCRPPALLPLFRFDDREPALNLASKVFDLLDEPYATEFFYACACLKAMEASSIAVLQVSSRLLNFAKCIKDRKRLIETGLVSAVVILPESLSQNEGDDTDALIILDRNASESIEFFDARHMGNLTREPDVPEYEHDTQELLQLIRSSRNANKPSERYRTESVDAISKRSWSLLPPCGFQDWEKLPKATIGELFSVTRGTPRSAIVKLPHADEIVGKGVRSPNTPPNGTGAPVDYFYLAMGTLEDGETLCFDTLRDRIGSDDTYDLADLYELEITGVNTGISSIKTVDPFCPHVLLSRFGFPFKVALANPAQREWDEEMGDYWSYWNENSVVLPDSMMDLKPLIEDGVDEPRCLPEYLLAVLSSNEGQNMLNATARGASIRQLSVGDVRKMLIPIPSLETQRSYARQFAEKQLAFEEARRAYENAQKEKRHLYF